MYFFLGNLSCLDICYSSVTLPILMANLLSAHKAISFLGCITQLHFFHFLGCTESILLAMMGFDRFVAICYPISRYTVIMNFKACILLATVAWITSFFMLWCILSWLHVWTFATLWNSTTSSAYEALLELACGDIRLNQWLIFIVTGSLGHGSVLSTSLSYLYIISFLLFKNRPCRGLHKASSSCAPFHGGISVLWNCGAQFYIPPASATSVSQGRYVAVIHTTVTSLLNPLIYTLRNKEVKLALKRVFGRRLKLSV